MTNALHDAVESGCLEEVCRLIKEDGVNLVNVRKTDTEETPIHIAARLGNRNIIKALLDGGADLNVPRLFEGKFCSSWSECKFADTVLIAAAYGHFSVLEVLLDSIGPHPLVNDIGKLCPPGSDTGDNPIEVHNILSPQNAVAIIKCWTLHFALYFGQIECAHWLIYIAKADVNELSSLNAISSFAVHPFYSALIDFPDLDGAPAVKTNEVVLELMKLLLDAGADINATFDVQDIRGKSEYWINLEFKLNALQCAAYERRWEVVPYLLLNGADINAKDEQGWTALHFAIANGSPDIVELLLKSGAAEQITSEFGYYKWTVLDIIGMSDDRLDRPINEVLVKDYVKIIKLLMSNGACLIAEPVAPAGFYPHDEPNQDAGCNFASVNRLVPMVSAFLQAGANPNAVNKLGQTPLHLLLVDVMGAIDNMSDMVYDDGYVDEEVVNHICSTVRVLAEAADLNIRNVKGRQPMQELVHGMTQYYEKKNNEYLANVYILREVVLQGASLRLLKSKHDLDPIIVELVRCGGRSWEAVPEPCIGLEKALFDVWKRGSTDELRYVFEKLEDRLKSRLQTGLLALNRILPGKTELHMQILAEGGMKSVSGSTRSTSPPQAPLIMKTTEQ